MTGILQHGISQDDIMQFLVRLFIVLMILPLHEFAHAWTAHKLGDDTAAYQGRLTLNPLAHVDPIGSLLLLLTGFGWAKPVPIDPTRFNRRHSIRFGMAVTAAAGPISNLIAAFVGMIALQFYQISSYYQQYLADTLFGEAVSNAPSIVFYLLYYFVVINIGLAVFNLIPIPPLDGSKVIGYFTPAGVDRWFARNAQIVRIVFLVLLFTGILAYPMSVLDGWIYRFLSFATSWIPHFFG